MLHVFKSSVREHFVKRKYNCMCKQPKGTSGFLACEGLLECILGLRFLSIVPRNILQVRQQDVFQSVDKISLNFWGFKTMRRVV